MKFVPALNDLQHVCLSGVLQVNCRNRVKRHRIKHKMTYLSSSVPCCIKEAIAIAISTCHNVISCCQDCCHYQDHFNVTFTVATTLGIDLRCHYRGY
jgi:hypothetical protein